MYHQPPGKLGYTKIFAYLTNYMPIWQEVDGTVIPIRMSMFVFPVSVTSEFFFKIYFFVGSKFQWPYCIPFKFDLSPHFLSKVSKRKRKEKSCSFVSCTWLCFFPVDRCGGLKLVSCEIIFRKLMLHIFHEFQGLEQT